MEEMSKSASVPTTLVYTAIYAKHFGCFFQCAILTRIQSRKHLKSNVHAYIYPLFAELSSRFYAYCEKKFSHECYFKKQLNIVKEICICLKHQEYMHHKCDRIAAADLRWAGEQGR